MPLRGQGRILIQIWGHLRRVGSEIQSLNKRQPSFSISLSTFFLFFHRPGDQITGLMIPSVMWSHWLDNEDTWYYVVTQPITFWGSKIRSSAQPRAGLSHQGEVTDYI